VGNSVPSHAYVVIGRNDVKNSNLPTTTLRERILKFLDRLREELPGTDITWAGMGALPLAHPARPAARTLVKAVLAYNEERGSRRPWLKLHDMCSTLSDDDLQRGGEAWTKEFANVFGTNLCHMMTRDLREFRMKRIRHLFNFAGPKSSVGVGNVSITS
jgi:hypothetical protein